MIREFWFCHNSALREEHRDVHTNQFWEYVFYPSGFETQLLVAAGQEISPFIQPSYGGIGSGLGSASSGNGPGAMLNFYIDLYYWLPDMQQSVINKLR